MPQQHGTHTPPFAFNSWEVVQRRAARFAKGDYRTTSSTTQMLRSKAGLHHSSTEKTPSSYWCTRLLMASWTYQPQASFNQLHHVQEGTLRDISQNFVGQTSVCTPSSPQASDFGTSYQIISPCQRPLRTSRGVWPSYISYIQECFYAFNLQFYPSLVYASLPPCT